MCERSRILVHIFGQGKDKACCPEFVFRGVISNAIYDLVLYLLYERLNVASIYDGTIPF